MPGLTCFIALAIHAAPLDVDFAREVAPILERHCVRCHLASDPKGDVRLDRPEDLRDLGFLDTDAEGDSELIRLVLPEVAGGRPRMPKSGAPLDPNQVDALRRWVDAGAPWPDGATLKDRSRADRSWWSLQPIATPEPPDPPGLTADWRANSIDRFVSAKLEEKGLAPNPPADRRTLIRRLTYDLTGLPPSPEEVQAFESDQAPLAYERLVDRLLASPAYGERQARAWLDVVRFGESRGFERNEIIPNAWPFRDYVIRSFNDDTPFDRLVLEHLAGDVVGPNDPEVEVGTTFLVAGPYDDVGNSDAAQAAQIRANTLDDVIVATGTAFLGLTIGCARCHDHKFDPIPQADYYRWYATFAGVRHGSRDVATIADRRARDTRVGPLQARRDGLAKEREAILEAAYARADSEAAAIESTWTRPAAALTGVDDAFEPVRASAIRLTVDATDANPEGRAGFHVDEIEAWTAGPNPGNVALDSSGATAEGAYRAAEDFAVAYAPSQAIDGVLGTTWIAAGPTLTLRFAQPETISRIVFSANREGTYHRPFVAEYRIEATEDGEHWREISSGRDRKPVSDRHRRKRLIDRALDDDERRRLAGIEPAIAALDAELAAIPRLANWWVGTFEQPNGPARVFTGGDPAKPADEVTASSLATLADVAPTYALPPDATESARREALARWITDPANPLTARVLANRIWQGHFGTGIVDTPGDFGFNGGQPTHPELLDWLARRLVDGRWQQKPLHRLIVTSRAYRQSSASRPDGLAADAADRLLWRFPPRRLSAEELRDSMLRVSGVLDQRMGGPGFRLYRYLQDNVSTYVPLGHHGPETYRRAIYHHNARAAGVDLLAEFDCPDSAAPAQRRDQTTTPLQALTLFNHAFTIDMATSFADRLRSEAGGDPTAQVERAFRLLYGRDPTPDEQAEAVAADRDHGLDAVARALLNSNEFLYLD